MTSLPWPRTPDSDPSREALKRHIPSRLRRGIPVAAILLLAGCEMTAPGLGLEPVALEVAPAELVLRKAQSATLSARAENSSGEPVSFSDVPDELRWASEDPAIAAVEPGGSVRAVAMGETRVRATLGALEAVAPVTVIGDPSRIRAVSDLSVRGVAGESVSTPLTVSVTDGQGIAVSGAPVTWRFRAEGELVSSRTVQTDTDGEAAVTWELHTAAGAQEATALLRAGDSVTFSASVDPGPVATVSVEPSEVSVDVGGTRSLEASAEDRYGNAVAVSTFEWASSDPGVASVNQTGVVTASALGTATITATAEGVEGSSSVTVTDPGTSPSSMTAVGGDGQTGVVGEALGAPLSVRVLNSDGDPLEGISVGWSVTAGDGSVAAASTATDGQGEAEVVWTLGTVAGGEQAVEAVVGGLAPVTFSATATPGPAASVSVEPQSASIAVDETVQLQAAASDAYGNDIPNATFSWTSSGSDVATVEETGLVTGRNEGNATIAATTDGVQGTSTVSVTSTAGDPGTVTDLAAIATTDSSVTLRWTEVDDGAGNPAKYAIRYGTPTIGDWGAAYSTEVSVTGASIGSPIEYTYTGLSASTDYEFRLVSYRGTLNVDATFGSLSNIAPASTTSGLGGSSVSSVVVSPDSSAFTAFGDTVQLSATAYDSLQNQLSGVNFDWASLDPSIASVDDMGRVISNGVGTTLVVATAVCCGAADSAVVAVDQNVAGVTVSPSSVWLNVGETISLSATAVDANGFTVMGESFTWSTSDAGVASVDATGVVTGRADGSATIRAGGSAGFSDSATVTVSSSGGGSGASPFFEDGFESGDLATSQNGFLWGVNGSQATGVNVAVSATNPRSGSRSLQFTYPAKPPGQDATAEQRFLLGGQYDELWIEYWFFVPSNFHHRSPGNNKLLRLWGPDELNPRAGLSFDPTGSNGDSWVYQQWGDYDNVMLGGQDGATWRPAFNDGSNGGQARGTWAQFRYHWKLASSDTAMDGVERLWVNGDLKIEKTGLDWHAGAGNANAFVAGYLMGWSNSGYDETTRFYLDDFKIYDTDPQW